MLDHKAYLFDHRAFTAELRPILERALATCDPSDIREFVVRNLGSLTDPYEGELLPGDWEKMVETRDAHQYGDFALTRYYDPSREMGLSYDWLAIQEELEKDSRLTWSPVLGHPVGPVNNLFDPGKLGSYFQSERDVMEGLVYLDGRQRLDSAEVKALRALLESAVAAGKGLYVTF